ncbi:hypothetical protein [Actinomadura sp. NEAU-AAG7]|uniref:hypothetical protein n=1 Tax=Actinomadura sp. NEAU-AAG7 TaxID=2839640 RepID=UPI001BE42A6C|nr:hypothetical protein [Actinomadura sp. NEAU-AAG7]MBT2211703.1 hypothetical protein [Actinomadura sp. NEAU-AAG7]
MTPSTPDRAEADPGAALHTGRWRLPSGRAMTKHTRQAIHHTLQSWGVGSAAGDLTDHLTALVHDVLARANVRGWGPIELRLELRASARLLLTEVRDAAPSLPGSGERGAPGGDGHGIIALTYGRRPARDGIRYIHSFTWWQPGAIAANR